MSKFRSTNKDDAYAILVAFSSVFLRFALGFSFLSAVGDRFGFWGSLGEHHVAWGTFARFVAYTGQLNWFLPKGTITTLAIVLREWRSLSTSQLHRISIQHRSTTTRFVWTSVGTLDLLASDLMPIVS